MRSRKPIRAVLFDMDGTVVDVPYNWPEIKEKLETRGVPILTHLTALEEPERSLKWEILTGYEDEATSRAKLKKGIVELLDLLARRGVRTALVTNNSGKNLRVILERFRLHFDLVLSRESGFWKPSAAPFRTVLERFGLEADECCVAGDSTIDIKAAEEAGIRSIFILSGEPERFSGLNVEILADAVALTKRLRRILRGQPKITRP